MSRSILSQQRGLTRSCAPEKLEAVSHYHIRKGHVEE